MRTDIKTLYIDFDGTLVNTIESIVGLYNEDFKYCICVSVSYDFK